MRCEHAFTGLSLLFLLIGLLFQSTVLLALAAYFLLMALDINEQQKTPQHGGLMDCDRIRPTCGITTPQQKKSA